MPIFEKIVNRYTKSDFYSPDWRIRYAAYEELGYTEEAKKDDQWEIRAAAYEKLDSIQIALPFNDKHRHTRNE